MRVTLGTFAAIVVAEKNVEWPNFDAVKNLNRFGAICKNIFKYFFSPFWPVAGVEIFLDSREKCLAEDNRATAAKACSILYLNIRGQTTLARRGILV